MYTLTLYWYRHAWNDSVDSEYWNWYTFFELVNLYIAVKIYIYVMFPISLYFKQLEWKMIMLWVLYKIKTTFKWLSFSPCGQVENLKENVLYQFQVRAVNQAGISESCITNVAFECKEWTVALPGKLVSRSRLIQSITIQRCSMNHLINT